MLSHAESGSVAPGIGYLRVHATTELFCGMKTHYGVALTRAGKTVSRVDGRQRVQVAGTLGLTQPGQLYRNVRREEPGAFQLLSFDRHLVEHVRAALDVGLEGSLRADELPAGDDRAEPLRRLHALALGPVAPPAARDAEAEAFTRDVVVAEAIAAFVSLLQGRAQAEHDFRPTVRRARAFLLENLAEKVTLDALAEHARTDKYHLCRAFSREVGVAPYTFLLQARIARARLLLAQGLRSSDVAQQVGFCDQSQLHRHFRRLVGCTPGAYARGG